MKRTDSKQTSSSQTPQKDTREMTTAEAGAIGGQRTAQLIEEGKRYEEEHTNERFSSKSRKH